MTREQINARIATAAGGVDPKTTERVLVGLEQVILAETQKGGNKFVRIMGLYQDWKNK